MEGPTKLFGRKAEGTYSDFLEIWKVTFFQAQSIGDRREGKGGRTEFAEQIKGLKEPEKDLKNRKPT